MSLKRAIAPAVAWAALLVFQPGVVAAQQAQSSATSAKPDTRLQASGRAAPAAAPRASAATGSTIFWGTDPRGVLVLSDRPDPNMSRAGSQTFTSSTDPSSLARAQRERDYWRLQSEQFQARQLERDRAQEAAQRVRVLEARERGIYQSAPVYYRGADWWTARNAPLVGGFAVPQVYSSSPGAAPAGPASFIGSGFSRASGR